MRKTFIRIAVVAFLLLVVFAASSGVAIVHASTQPINISSNAQTPSPLDCFTDAPTCLVFYISLTLNGVMSLFLSFGAFLIRSVLAFNANIRNSPFVQKGFGVSLSLANLGFVLAIIVIAIATILRSETYGYKKALWRLIAMAILVNFGLAITVPIISFADSMTNYFVDAVGGQSATATEGQDDAAFVTNITAAFAPQSLLAPPTTPGKALLACAGAILTQGIFAGSALCGSGLAAVPDPADSFTQSVLALIFSFIFLTVITFTYFALAILLFVRYVYLLLLLVTLPLGWLMWIFPKFNHLFSKWWNEFVKWTFFPVAAMFFIYLAYIMIAPSANSNAANPGQATYLSQVGQTENNGVTIQNLPETAIATNIGSSGPIAAGLDAFALCGLMIGGLMMASSLAGKAGGFAVGQAQAASRGVQKYVGEKTKKSARLAYNKAGLPAVANRLREGRLGGLENVPVAGWLARRGAQLAGRGMANISTNQKMVDEEKKNVPKDHNDIRKDLAGGGLSKQQIFAWLADYAKQGKLNENTMVGNKKAADFFDENGALFDRYGQGKLRVDANKSFMGNQAYRDARRKGDKATMQTEMDKFLNDFDKKDSSHVHSDSLFNENADQNDVDVRLHALAERPDLVPNIYKKLNGKNQKFFEEKYGAILEQGLGGYDTQITADQSREADPLKRQLESNKTQREGLNAQIQAIKERNETLRRGRALATGRDQESIDRDIAANDSTAQQLQDQIAGLSDVDKATNVQLSQINKRFTDNAPAKVQRLRKAKTAFDRLFINNASEGAADEKEEKKDENKGSGDKNSGGGGGDHH